VLRRILRGMAVALGVAVLAGSIWLIVLLVDESPTDDSDLRIVRPEVAVEENAVTWFQAAAEKSVWPKADFSGDFQAESAEPQFEDAGEPERVGMMLEGKGWDEELAIQVFEDNEEAFRLLRRATECKECVVPPCDLWTEMPWVYGLLQLSNVAQLKAAWLMRQGREEEALVTGLELIEVGGLVQRGRGPLVPYLVANVLKGTGCYILRDVAARSSPDTEALKGAARRLGRLTSRGDELALTYRAEYEMWASLVDKFKAGTLPPEMGPRLGFDGLAVFLKVNGTKRLLASSLRVLAANATRPYAEMSRPPAPYGEQIGVMSLLCSTNPTGKLVYLSAMGWSVDENRPALDGPLWLKCRHNSDMAATQVLLALVAYRAERGRLPSALNELVPEYLDAIPLDDFDGQPLRYNNREGVVYSVGRDLKDEGGAFLEGEEAAEGDTWSLFDPGYRVPAPKN